MTSKAILLVKSLRIKEWRGYVGLSLFGLAYGANDFLIFIKNLPKLIVLIFLYMSIVYLTNNIFDSKGDSLNLRKRNRNPFAQNLLETSEGLLFLVFFILAAVVTAFLTYNFAGFLNYLIALLLAIFYSMPPLRFKEKPIIDLLSHSLFFGVSVLLLGFFIASNSSYIDIFLILSIAIYSIQLELRNEIEDFEADYHAGYKTTAVWLGYTRCNKLLMGITVLFILSTVLALSNYGSSFPASITPFALALPLANKRIDYNFKMRLIDAYVVVYLLTILFLNFTLT